MNRPTQSLKNEKGFTIIEVLVGLGVLGVIVFIYLDTTDTLNTSLVTNRTTATRDRVLLGIQNLAGMPAALRNSMRASNGAVPVNPKLLACVGGNPLNGCESNVSHPLTLYSPIVARAPTGEVIGIQAISAPVGSSTPMRLDTFGAPCANAGPQCPFLVYTSFKAQCGPPALDPSAPPLTSAQLVPMPTCTVADVIEVTFYLQLDPTITSTDSSYSYLRNQIEGSVVTSVVSISGNLPQ